MNKKIIIEVDVVISSKELDRTVCNILQNRTIKQEKSFLMYYYPFHNSIVEFTARSKGGGEGGYSRIKSRVEEENYITQIYFGPIFKSFQPGAWNLVYFCLMELLGY